MQTTIEAFKNEAVLPLPTAARNSGAGESLRARFDAWQDAVRAPALSVLLAMQVVFIFFMGPLMSTGTLPRWLLEVSQMLLPLVSFFVLPRHSKVRLLILLSAVLLAGLGMLEAGKLVGLLLRMLVTLAITLLVAQAVFQARTVTAHQLLGAVVVYLNLALLFMGIFAAITHAVPNAFTTPGHAPLKAGELLYFSLTTITSTGYGDLLPVYPLARSMANLEAVTGQLFPRYLPGAGGHAARQRGQKRIHAGRRSSGLI